MAEPRSSIPGPGSSTSTPTFASRVSASGMRSASATTTPTVGSRPPLSDSAIPLVSNDGVFVRTPGLVVETAPAG